MLPELRIAGAKLTIAEAVVLESVVSKPLLVIVGTPEEVMEADFVTLTIPVEEIVRAGVAELKFNLDEGPIIVKRPLMVEVAEVIVRVEDGLIVREEVSPRVKEPMVKAREEGMMTLKPVAGIVN